VNTGQVISAAGHATLIGWMVFGGIVRTEQLPIEATEVSVISGEAFAALMAAQDSPISQSEVAQPVQPVVDKKVVDVPALETTPEQETPDTVPAPSADDAPDVSELIPLPDVEVSDEAPVLPTPEPKVAVEAPETSETPVPQASVRVAPEAVNAPDPKARPDPVEQEAVQQAETGETVVEPQEATAPEEAATEIVTEAEQPAAAPETSLRPPLRRPTRPAVQAVETSEPVTEAVAQEQSGSSAVDDALAEALGQVTETPRAPSSPPLSAGEKDALRVAVQDCWNVGSLSSLALETTVVVAVSLTQDGKPVVSSIRQVGSEGGTSASVNQAFETARRAIIRCGARGFQLPSDKYDQWKDTEMTFNPERMRIK
jgi:hypothetical protein